VQSYVRYGPGPRGAQAIVLTAKVNALLDERAHVAVEDVIDAALPALRHRLILNFQGEAEEGVHPDRIIGETLKAQKRP
jgi:MoxR-like ATPase